MSPKERDQYEEPAASSLTGSGPQGAIALPPSPPTDPGFLRTLLFKFAILFPMPSGSLHNGEALAMTNATRGIKEYRK